MYLFEHKYQLYGLYPLQGRYFATAVPLERSPNYMWGGLRMQDDFHSCKTFLNIFSLRLCVFYQLSKLSQKTANVQFEKTKKGIL